MGSAIQHVGPLGSGALAKLTTNTLLGMQVAVLGELVGMLQHSGADVARVLDAVATTPVWSTVAGRIAGSMLAGNFAPQFPIELIEKDFGYTVQAAGSDIVAPTIAAARSVFCAAIKRGLGGEKHDRRGQAVHEAVSGPLSEARVVNQALGLAHVWNINSRSH
ncbi:NAD-binding protein [Pseudomonas putida]|uniref:NAD-binding protein n=1 Tax=Pseudomonas putida TaxID=303 RepID=UPI0027511C17|nr:NAD-binding protein [Pseudomonas putida]MDP9524313.1 NAD-binding protein [Pseudomonas putida]